MYDTSVLHAYHGDTGDLNPGREAYSERGLDIKIKQIREGPIICARNTA